MAVVRPDLEESVRQQLAAVVELLRPAELATEIVEHLLEAIPELERPADIEFRQSLARSSEANVRAVLSQMVSGAPFDTIAPQSESIAYAHELVHRGVDLTAMLRSYRLGHALLERRFEQAALSLELDRETLWRTVSYASHCMFAYVDAVCTDLVRYYEQERARWIRGAAAARAEMVEMIIARRPVEPRIATDRLRYDVRRQHLAMILWRDQTLEPDPSGSLETEAIELAEALGGGPVLTVPIGERVLWAWTSGAEIEDDPGAIGHRMGDGVRAAIGTCIGGLEGMAYSHEQARAARRLAQVRGRRSGAVVGYRTGGLAALLTADPAEAVRFTEAELGDLLDHGDASARTRATLRVYLEENLSPARAARRLGVHQNTIVYRVKRAEELLGHAIERGRLNLEVALQLAELLDGLRAAAAEHSDSGRRPPDG